MNWQTAGETEATNASDIRFKLALGGHLAHITDGIMHASERRVEADAFGRSNFLETHLLIIKHAHDVLLGLWQTADERIDFAEVSAEVILTLVDIILQTVCRHPFYFLTAKGVILRLLFSETVNDDIMGDAGEPDIEFAILNIPSFTQGDYHLEKGFLKDVVSDVLIMDIRKDVSEKPVFISYEQCVESLVETFHIQFDQLLIGVAG